MTLWIYDARNFYIKPGLFISLSYVEAHFYEVSPSLFVHWISGIWSIKSEFDGVRFNSTQR